jgi:hypothetical protein
MNDTALATNEQVLAFLALANARPKQNHGTAPDILDGVLRALRVVRYETEKALVEITVASYKGIRVSKKTGKEIATFVLENGEYRSLFLNQIQL